MTQKITAAKPGFDALTETDPNNFIFHSDYNTFKIIKRGASFPMWANTGGLEVEKTFAHGQSYTPFVFAFGRVGVGRYTLPGSRDYMNDFWWTSLRVDATNIRVKAIYGGGGFYQLKVIYFVVEVPL